MNRQTIETHRQTLVTMADSSLLKEMKKLVNRIERILVPHNSLVHSTIGSRLDALQARVQKGEFFENVNAFPVEELLGYEPKSIEALVRRVAWDSFEAQLMETLSEGDAAYALHPEAQLEIETERRVHADKLAKAATKEKVRRLQSRNGLPALPGKWRKEPYGKRSYEWLEEYYVTRNISEAEGAELKDQLITPLDGFLGQAYNFDDHDITEDWMMSFRDKNAARASEDDVIKTQLESLLEIMMMTVQDRVCTQERVLQKEPMRLGVDIKEVPVWGIDSYTRRMVEMAFEDRLPLAQRSPAVVRRFIEGRLLPAINAQSPEKAHDMSCAVAYILEGSEGSGVAGGGAERRLAETLAAAIEENSIDTFRIHPKGQGVVCMRPEGIPAHVFITEYLGEVYPPYRWCERLDVVEQAQETFELKPTLPDFYNILLERPRHDPRGYGLLYVDASQRSNVGSSCSHSCDSNCTSAVVARNGKLVIALTSNRRLSFGEELTMDYYSITTSETEWRAAICLCGSTACRGSFLHFATQDDLQQVLNQNCGPLCRYASLLRACSDLPMQSSDADSLRRHGMLDAALGASPPTWVSKYAADNLRFVEFERKALPCALLRSGSDGKSSQYSFMAADMDARSVMEQRLQSLVSCFSMVQRVIDRNAAADHEALTLTNGALKGALTLKNEAEGEGVEDKGSGKDKGVPSPRKPLVPYTPSEAVAEVWARLTPIPRLLQRHLLDPAKTALEGAKTAAQEEAKRRGTVASPGPSPKSHKAKSPLGPLGASLGASMAPPGAPKAAPVKAVLSSEAREKLRHREAAVASISAAIDQTKVLLQERPKGLAKLRETCLALRGVLKAIESTATAKARVGQLADLLVLWAHTQNFSTVAHFEAVESGPLQVFARELGTNIPRSKIYKHYSHRAGPRRRGAEEEDGSPREGGGGGGGGEGEGVIGAGEEEVLQCSDCTFTTAESPDMSADLYFDRAADKDTAPTAAVTSTSTAATTSTTTATSTSTTSAPTAASTSTAPAPPTGKEYLVDPSEAVFTGTKKYPSLFAFWQLMGWFNAGTDQKIEAPDLFGCVELPTPAMCFGQAEPYTAKQREALVGQLRDDKAQTMSWPPSLKNCFTQKPKSPPTTTTSTASAYFASSNPASATATATAPSATALKAEKPLYGSPMLEEALGQVGAVKQVLSVLLEGVEAKKKGKGVSGRENAAQFDSNLPPEIPTDWAQCEACKKWRRVAWFVDSKALPDEWHCTMNTWDADNATCAAPQDDFDPDTENTLGYSAGDRQKFNEASFPRGKKFDLFCNVNQVYYEATVEKLVSKKGYLKPKVLFHFMGWGHKFDETIAMDSERIQPHNLHTNPCSSDPRGQEKWQGLKISYAFHGSKAAKKASTAVDETESKGGKGGAGKGGTGGKGGSGGTGGTGGAAGGAKKAPAKRKRVTKAVSRKKPAVCSSAAAAVGAGKGVVVDVDDDNSLDDFDEPIAFSPTPLPTATVPHSPLDIFNTLTTDTTDTHTGTTGTVDVPLAASEDMIL